jgi:hypothetical protein
MMSVTRRIAVHHLLHRGAGLVDQLGAGVDLGDRGADQFLDFLGRRGRALGQVAHFRGHDREAAALFAGARRFHGGVQRQDVGLEGDAVDDADDVDDLARDSLIEPMVVITWPTTAPPSVATSRR